MRPYIRGLITVCVLVFILISYIIFGAMVRREARGGDYIPIITPISKISYFIASIPSKLKKQKNNQNQTSALIKETRFVVEQKFNIDEPFIAFSEKLIYKNNERIKILFAGESKVNMTMEYYDNSGKLRFIDSNTFDSNVEIETLISSTDGYLGETKSFFLLPKIDNGWVEIFIKPQYGKEISIPVFIEKSESSDILFVESTDTFNAYVSAYGLPTHYSRNTAPLGAYTRPKSMPQHYNIQDYNKIENINCKDHLINSDLIWKQFFTKKSISFNSVSDKFLEDYDNIKNCKMIIFGAHNEYWTKQKADNILNFVNEGGHLIFLGGNTAWRTIERNDSYDIIYGENLLDNGFDIFINEVLGSYFSTIGYDTYAPYQILDIEKFKSIISIDKGNIIFSKGSDFETCTGYILGGSGSETDKLLSSANSQFSILAKGKNNSKGGAELVYRDIPNGGSILNFGSISLWHRTSDKIIGNLIIGRLMEALNHSTGNER